MIPVRADGGVGEVLGRGQAFIGHVLPRDSRRTDFPSLNHPVDYSGDFRPYDGPSADAGWQGQIPFRTVRR